MEGAQEGREQEERQKSRAEVKSKNHAQCGRDGRGLFFGWVESLSREVIRDKDKNKGWMKEVDFKHL